MDILRTTRKEDVNLRAKLISNLAIYINDLRQQQDEVILMIEGNESMTKTNSGISNLKILAQLCDPTFMIHGANRESNIYIRRIERIYYLFCTPKLLKYIIRCEILPFDMVTTADHRCTYLDIKLRKCLKDHFQEHQEPIQRHHYSKFAKGVVKYKDYLCKYTNNNNIIETIQCIKQKLINNTLLIEDMGIINDVDSKMTTGMLKVEKQIKIRNKHHPWSPTLALAILILHLCKIIYSEVIHKTNKSETFASIFKQMNKYKPMDCKSIERVDKRIIKQKIRVAKTQLRKIQKSATEFREDHLSQLAEEAEEEENYAHARYLRNPISIENHQQMHIVIRSYTKDKVNSSLTYIDVPKEYPKNWNDVPKYLPATSLRRVDIIEEMKKIINERNKQHIQPNL